MSSGQKRSCVKSECVAVISEAGSYENENSQEENEFCWQHGDVRTVLHGTVRRRVGRKGGCRYDLFCPPVNISGRRRKKVRIKKLVSLSTTTLCDLAPLFLWNTNHLSLTYRYHTIVVNSRSPLEQLGRLPGAQQH